MAKKIDEDIDEDFIIASMNMTGPSASDKIHPVNKIQGKQEIEESERQKENTPVKEEKETRKRKSKSDYEGLFIRQADIAGRQEKTIYVREKYYDRIDKVIKLYNNPRLSVFSYVDAVLELHFEIYEQEIKELYRKLYIPPFDE